MWRASNQTGQSLPWWNSSGPNWIPRRCTIAGSIDTATLKRMRNENKVLVALEEALHFLKRA